MDSEHVTDWVNSWGPLITLASTILLALITAWLAYLTLVMARSARESTSHARTAAEASLAAVAASEASIEVDFAVEPVQTTNAGAMRGRLEELVESGEVDADSPVDLDAMIGDLLRWTGLNVTCKGNTVSLHGCVVAFVGVDAEPGRPEGVRFTHGESCELDTTSDEDLPILCHKGESVRFDLVEPTEHRSLAEIHAEIAYAIGAGAVRRRRVEWKASRRAAPQASSET